MVPRGERKVGRDATDTTRPDLAHQVRHIEVDHINPCTLSAELTEQLSTAAAHLKLNLLPGWSNSPKRLPLVLLELLLLHTPNVRTIHLLMDRATTFSDLASFSWLTPGAFALPFLTTLTATRYRRLTSFDFSSVMQLVKAAPKLRTLSIHQGRNFESRHDVTPALRTLHRSLDDPFAALENITFLTLDRCDLTLRQAGDLITACTRLEVFHMVLIDELDMQEHFPELEAMDPANSMSAQLFRLPPSRPFPLLSLVLSPSLGRPP